MAVSRHRDLSAEDAAWFDTSSWLKVHTSIADVLRSLQDAENVTVEAHDVAARPTPRSLRQSLWSRLLGRPHQETSSPYVRLTRRDTIIACECVGGVHFGGEYWWTESEEQVLLHIGWQPWRSPHPFYRAQFPRMTSDAGVPEEYAVGSDADEAAHLAVRTMRNALKLEPSDLDADVHNGQVP